MRRVNRIITFILTIIVTLIILNTTIFGAINLDNIINNDPNVKGETEIKNISSYILSGITSVGIAISVVVLAVIGVKYMLGSADERAEYKKSMMPYLIGAVLLFSASTIANAIYQLAK